MPEGGGAIPAIFHKMAFVGHFSGFVRYSEPRPAQNQSPPISRRGGGGDGRGLLCLVHNAAIAMNL